MTRRLLGPVGGPILFFCVAALVFAGLGWVTVAALRVERAQRESASRAELESNLRIALWKLDCRMLPTLGVEDSRPYYHFSSAELSTTYGPASAPLLGNELPPWMKLHFQLAPDTGWVSPQVLAEGVAPRLEQLWPDQSFRNVTTDRAACLANLNQKYPPAGVVATLTARDLATPADSPLATGIFNVQEVEHVQQQPDSGPVPPPSAVPIGVPPSVTPPPVDAENLSARPSWWNQWLAYESSRKQLAAQAARGVKDEGAGQTAFSPPQPAGRAADGAAVSNSAAPPPRPTAQAPENYQQAVNPPGNRGGQRDNNNDMRANPNFESPTARTVSQAMRDAAKIGGRGDYSHGKVQIAQNPSNTANPPGTSSSAPPAGPSASGGFGSGGPQGNTLGGGGFGGTPPGGAFGLPPGMGLPATGQPQEPGGRGGSGGAPRGASVPGGGPAPPGFAPPKSPAPPVPAVIPVAPAGAFGGRPSGASPARVEAAAGDAAGKNGKKDNRGEPLTAGVEAPSALAKNDIAGGFFNGTGGETGAKSFKEIDESGKSNAGGTDAAKGGTAKPSDDPRKPATEAGDAKKRGRAADAKGAFFDLLQQARRAAEDQTNGESKEDRKRAETTAPPKPPGDADRAAGDDPTAANPTPAPAVSAPPVAVTLGSMRPQWLPPAADGTDELVLVRTAKVDGKTVYQGVVLDWEKLRDVLKEEVKGQLPGATLEPVRDPAGVNPERAMASLPVQIDPGAPPELPPAGMTPLRLGLVLAWVAAFIAFAAVGLSGWSLIDSSERRIRFVSAVTHELRTPLTSFRLYIDLLLSGMVDDEEKRKEYLATLNVESDRLHRLIDNVLDFARLEGRRRKTYAHPTCVGDMLETMRQTWCDRCGNDGKELIVVSTLPPDLAVCTDVQLVQQIVGNLIDNARKYTRDAADQRIWLWAKPGGARRVVFEVEDRGPGVPPRERRSIFHPFRRGDDADARAGGAGLGLALAKQWAEALGGRLTYRPADGGTGACFRLELPVK